MKKCNYLKKIKICFLNKDNEKQRIIKAKIIFSCNDLGHDQTSSRTIRVNNIDLEKESYMYKHSYYLIRKFV